MEAVTAAAGHLEQSYEMKWMAEENSDNSVQRCWMGPFSPGFFSQWQRQLGAIKIQEKKKEKL